MPTYPGVVHLSSEHLADSRDALLSAASDREASCFPCLVNEWKIQPFADHGQDVHERLDVLALTDFSPLVSDRVSYSTDAMAMQQWYSAESSEDDHDMPQPPKLARTHRIAPRSQPNSLQSQLNTTNAPRPLPPQCPPHTQEFRGCTFDEATIQQMVDGGVWTVQQADLCRLRQQWEQRMEQFRQDLARWAALAGPLDVNLQWPRAEEDNEEEEEAE